MTAAPARAVKIGPYSLPSIVVLAPMAGVTDRPFRILCRRFGAGLAASEMLSADVRLWDTPKSRRRMDHAGEPSPRVVQIAGFQLLQCFCSHRRVAPVAGNEVEPALRALIAGLDHQHATIGLLGLVGISGAASLVGLTQEFHHRIVMTSLEFDAVLEIRRILPRGLLQPAQPLFIAAVLDGIEPFAVDARRGARTQENSGR